ncbi:MAG: anhydro-N-acetylmuramic acid kinase, partial [Bdellovibrionota bacterium]
AGVRAPTSLWGGDVRFMAVSGIYLGLLSGTSADGVDAALARIEAVRGKAPRFKGGKFFRCYPFPAEIKKRILALGETPAPDFREILQLDVLLGELFAVAAAECCREAGVSLSRVKAIGSHGQTVRHLPERVQANLEFAGSRRRFDLAATLQIGDPSIIAERTGRPVVARFRQRDMAAGGQGAPLVPAFHLALLGKNAASAAVVNVGGIANATLPGKTPLAFDTGPGNMVMDALASRLLPGNPSHDEDGKSAAKGSVREKLLAEFLSDPYFQKKPPKSTGREYFGKSFVDRFESRGRALGLSRPEDFLATATTLTARSIAKALEDFSTAKIKRVYLCGGGAHNETLGRMITDALPQARVETTAALGAGPDAVEALAFAYLAACHEAGWPGNVPSATGARRAAILGERVPGAKA